MLDRTQRQTVAHLNPTRRVDKSPLPRFDPAFEIDPAAVVEAAAESVLVTTADLDPPGPTILYVNPAFEKMTGWSRADVVGKSPRILQGPHTDRRVFADLRQTLLAGRAWQALAINYRKDGSEFFMEWSIVPLKDSRGEIYQYVAVQRDVTGRIEADRRLGEAQAAERRADRARTNLARYFSPKLVDILATKDQPLGPVRRQVLAVLFADIAGFHESRGNAAAGAGRRAPAGHSQVDGKGHFRARRPNRGLHRRRNSGDLRCSGTGRSGRRQGAFLRV